MSYKRLSLRFNMADIEDRKAWDYLHRKGITVIGKEIIRLINDAEKYRGLEDLLRHIISEELGRILFEPSFEIQPVRTEQEKKETEESILNFLNSL